MALRNKQPKKRAAARADLPLLDEIEQTVESSVRALLKKKGGLSVAELVKLRDIVREILAERPHEVVVRWVDPEDDDDDPAEPGDGGTGASE